MLSYSNRQKKINYDCLLSMVAMLAYLTHVVDEIIGSPSAKHLLLIVADRFV